MKFKIVVLFFALNFVSCGNNNETKSVSSPHKPKVENKYPVSLQKLFETYGGLNKWQENSALKMVLTSETEEILFERNIESQEMRISGPDFSMGRDANGVWFLNESGKINKELFSHLDKLFFSASAPFIVAQEGAFYTQRLDEMIQRKNYGVLHIGFGRGFGKSVDDEYILYYDKETHEIDWVAFSEVNYGNYKSKSWKFAKLTNFQNVDGLLVPQKFEVYESSNNAPTKFIETYSISELKLIEQPFEKSIFKAPEGSVF